jgi:hypothetical protein
MMCLSSFRRVFEIVKLSFVKQSKRPDAQRQYRLFIKNRLMQPFVVCICGVVSFHVQKKEKELAALTDPAEIQMAMEQQAVCVCLQS